MKGCYQVNKDLTSILGCDKVSFVVNIVPDSNAFTCKPCTNVPAVTANQHQDFRTSFRLLGSCGPRTRIPCGGNLSADLDRLSEAKVLLLTSLHAFPPIYLRHQRPQLRHKMSDSDSDLSTPANLPTDAEIESTILKVVRARDNDEDLSIKIARARAEEELGLPTDFFKNDGQWKERSKELITAAFEESEEEDAPAVEKKTPVKTKPKPKSQPKPRASAGTKRKSDEAPKSKPMRQKKSPSVELSDIEAELSAKESEDSRSKAPRPKTKPQSNSEETSALSSPPEDESEPAALKQNGNHSIPAEDDGSDLSSVIDDAPPKKKRGSKAKPSSPSATSKAKAKPKQPKAAKATTKPDISPDEEEIKRLQSWLLKCGIRKLWHRELAHCSTAKEKIEHLKGMLDDIGMTGRFSAEKARQIKESRELAAELEAAREFNEQWGQAESDEEDEDDEKDGGKKGKVKEKKVEVEEPVKRRPMGLVDFGDSGEESD